MRKPRSESPTGAMYHVYARGNDGCSIFRDDGDRALYLRLLAEVTEQMGWSLLAYCLMDNHVHLIIQTREGNLGRGMQRLHGRFGAAFNRRHRRSGHLFQGRYGSTVIEDDGHLAMALRYVALNPVNARMCRRPEEHVWSSCRATLEGTTPPWLDRPLLLRCYEWLGGDPVERYAEMLAP